MPIMWFCHDELQLPFDTLNSYIELQIESRGVLPLSLSLSLAPCVFILALAVIYDDLTRAWCKIPMDKKAWRASNLLMLVEQTDRDAFFSKYQSGIDLTPQFPIVLPLLLLYHHNPASPTECTSTITADYFMNYANDAEHGKLTLAKFYFCMVDVISRRRIFFPFVRSLACSFVYSFNYFVFLSSPVVAFWPNVSPCKSQNGSCTKNAFQIQASRATATTAAANNFLWIVLLQIDWSHNPVGCNSVGWIMAQAQCHNTHILTPVP